MFVATTLRCSYSCVFAALRCVERSGLVDATRRIAGGADVVHAGDLYLVRILSLSEQISNMMALELS